MNPEIKNAVEVDDMYSLGWGIREQGRIEGIIEGRNKQAAKIILNMYQKGFSYEQIAELVDKSIDEVKAVMDKQEGFLS